MTTPEILPCPCGSEPIFVIVGGGKFQAWCHKTSKSCLARGPVCGSRDEAVERWNDVARKVQAHGALVEALKRAVTLMDATERFVEKNPIGDYTVFFDEADCDGSCLAVDCAAAVLEAKLALAGAE